MGTHGTPSKDSWEQWTGKVVGEYEIGELLGAGGNGQVFKARHRCLDIPVAFKILRSVERDDEVAVKRFRREAMATARLNHPNLIRATDAGVLKRHPFLVTEFVDGKDLYELAAVQGLLSITNVCQVGVDVCEGLEFLAKSGVVHRDIKPSNIMVDKAGHVRILDLGIAHTFDQCHSLAMEEDVVGTLDFISPEQALRPKEVTFQADMYSLGCTLYFLLIGRAPFCDEMYQSVPAKMLAHIEVNPDHLSQVREDVPHSVANIIMEMMEKHAFDRPSTFREVIDILAKFADGSNLAEIVSSSAVDPAPESDSTKSRVQSYPDQPRRHSALERAYKRAGMVACEKCGMASRSQETDWCRHCGYHPELEDYVQDHPSFRRNESDPVDDKASPTVQRRSNISTSCGIGVILLATLAVRIYFTYVDGARGQWCLGQTLGGLIGFAGGHLMALLCTLSYEGNSILHAVLHPKHVWKFARRTRMGGFFFSVSVWGLFTAICSLLCIGGITSEMVFGVKPSSPSQETIDMSSLFDENGDFINDAFAAETDQGVPASLQVMDCQVYGFHCEAGQGGIRQLFCCGRIDGKLQHVAMVTLEKFNPDANREFARFLAQHKRDTPLVSGSVHATWVDPVVTVRLRFDRWLANNTMKSPKVLKLSRDRAEQSKP